MQQIDATKPPADGTPWNPWTSLGMTFVACVLPSFLLAVPMVSMQIGRMLDPNSTAKNLSAETVSLALQAAGPIMSVGLLLLFVRARRGWSSEHYLAVGPVRTRTVLTWALIGLLVQAGVMFLLDLLHVEVIPPLPSRLYTPPWVMGLFAICWSLMKGTSEELILRGFLQRGFETTSFNAITVAFITSGLWLIMIKPSGVTVGMFWLAYGVGLSLIRWKTASLWPCLAIHALGDVGLIAVATWRAMVN